MTRTRAFVASAAIGLSLAACGGVDRDGTRDSLIESLEASGVEIDADCVDAALDNYDDEALKAIDEALKANESTPESEALMGALVGCIPTGG